MTSLRRTCPSFEAIAPLPGRFPRSSVVRTDTIGRRRRFLWHFVVSLFPSFQLSALGLFRWWLSSEAIVETQLSLRERTLSPYGGSRPWRCRLAGHSLIPDIRAGLPRALLLVPAPSPRLRHDVGQDHHSFRSHAYTAACSGARGGRPRPSDAPVAAGMRTRTAAAAVDVVGSPSSPRPRIYGCQMGNWFALAGHAISWPDTTRRGRTIFSPEALLERRTST